MIRFVVPVVSPEGLGSKVSEHFARSEYFAILVADDDRLVSAEVVHCAPEDDKKKAELLANRGVDVVLAGRIGSCMIRVFMDRGIPMFSGAEGTVAQAFKDYKAGKLAEVRPNPYQL
jgi:predicted Fe-Mo cluster-binding NifX family protein